MPLRWNRDTEPRWPLEPLWELSRCRTMRSLERRCGLSLGSLRRWVVTGLPDRFADRAAIALGYHPAQIWPGWFAAAATDAAAEQAGEPLRSA